MGGTKKLIIGDSIIKHLDKATVFSNDDWKQMNWVNAGLSRDCLENVHWRIKDWIDSKDVVKIILAARTNNIIKNSAEEIWQEIGEIHRALI